MIKRRVLTKHCRTRALHLGQDRYRRHYWHFSHLPGVYVEGLRTGDLTANELKDMVESTSKQRSEKKLDGLITDVNPLSRSAQRKRPQTKPINGTLASSLATPVEPTTSIKSERDDPDVEPQTEAMPTSHAMDDRATMDLSAFCLPAKEEAEEPMVTNTHDEEPIVTMAHDEEPVNVTTEPNDEPPVNGIANENLPLDLSCSTSKRVCDDDYWASQRTQAAYPLPRTSAKFDRSDELNASAVLLNNVKQERMESKGAHDMKHSHRSGTTSVEHESSVNNFKQIEHTIRERFQYAQPLPIPDGTYFLIYPVLGNSDSKTLPYFRRAVGLVVYSDERRITPSNQIISETWPTRTLSLPNASTLL